MKLQNAKLSRPIPTRFTGAETAFLSLAARKTGLPVSEIIRRSVRLLKQNVRTSAGYQIFIALNR